MHSRIARYTLGAINRMGAKAVAQKTVPFRFISGGKTYADTFAKRFGEAAKENGFFKTMMERATAHTFALGYELPKNIIRTTFKGLKNLVFHPKTSVTSAWKYISDQAGRLFNRETADQLRRQATDAAHQVSEATSKQYARAAEYAKSFRAPTA